MIRTKVCLPWIVLVSDEGGALAILRHVGPQVIDTNFLRIARVYRASGEKEHVGFDALGIKNARRQSKNGVQVTLVHEVAANVFADAALEKDVVRQHDGGTASGQQAPINVLEKAELFVAGGKGEIRA